MYGIILRYPIATNINPVTVCAITEPWPTGLSALSKLYPLAKIDILIKKKYIQVIEAFQGNAQ